MPTIKDVAKEAGVSIATVSRVLNNRGSLSEKMINKVNNAMTKLNYHPNVLARSLVNGKHYCIGVLIPSIEMPFWAKLTHEVERAADKHGYSIMIAISPSDTEAYIEKFECLRASMPDGIITSYTPNTEDYIHQSPTPTVVIGNVDYAPSVSSNDEQGGLLATRHLIAKGCKKLIHISGELGSRSTANARSYAFIKECDNRNIDYKVYQASEDQLRNMNFAGIISNIFYENPEFDGIFASNDIMAAHCISTALALGYKIPDSIKIIGYDDISISSLIYPSLTTIHQNYQQIAEVAVETLIDLVAGKEVPDRQVIPVKLIERKTT